MATMYRISLYVVLLGYVGYGLGMKPRSVADGDRFQHLEKKIDVDKACPQRVRKFLQPLSVIKTDKEEETEILQNEQELVAEDTQGAVYASLYDTKLMQKFAKKNSLPHMVLYTDQLLKKSKVDYEESQKWVIKCQRRLYKFLDSSKEAKEEASKAWHVVIELNLENSCKTVADQAQNYHMQFAYGTLQATVATVGVQLGLIDALNSRKKAIEGRDYLRKALTNVQTTMKQEINPSQELRDIEEHTSKLIQYLEDYNSNNEDEGTIKRIQNIILDGGLADIKHDGYKCLINKKEEKGINFLKKYIESSHKQKKVVKFSEYFTVGCFTCSFHPEHTEIDDKTAFRCLKKAADTYVENEQEKTQRAFASLLTGHLCMKFEPVKEMEITVEDTLRYYRRAADLGNVLGKYYMGIVHYQNKQYEQAQKCFSEYIKKDKKCAERDDAQWYLGVMKLCNSVPPSKETLKKIEKLSAIELQKYNLEQEKKTIAFMCKLSETSSRPINVLYRDVLMNAEVSDILEKRVHQIIGEKENLSPQEADLCYVVGYLLTHASDKYYDFALKCLIAACNNDHYLSNNFFSTLPVPDSFRYICFWDLKNLETKNPKQAGMKQYAQDQLEQAAYTQGKLLPLWYLAVDQVKKSLEQTNAGQNPKQELEAWLNKCDAKEQQIPLTICDNDLCLWQLIIETYGDDIYDPIEAAAEKGNITANILLGGALAVWGKSVHTEHAIEILKRSLKYLRHAFIKHTNDQFKKTLANVYLSLAEKLRESGNCKDALAMCDISIKFGNIKQGELTKALMNIELGNQENESLEIFKKYAAQEDTSALFYLGGRALAENKFNEALTYFKRAYNGGHKKAARCIAEVEKLKSSTNKKISYLEVAYDCFVDTDAGVRARTACYFKSACSLGLDKQSVVHDKLLKYKFDLLHENFKPLKDLINETTEKVRDILTKGKKDSRAVVVPVVTISHFKKLNGIDRDNNNQFPRLVKKRS